MIAEEKIRGFGKVKKWEPSKVVLGLSGMQYMNLEAVLLRKEPTYQLHHNKAISKIYDPSKLQEWNYGDERTRFFKEIGIVPFTEEEKREIEKKAEERNRRRKAKLAQSRKARP